MSVFEPRTACGMIGLAMSLYFVLHSKPNVLHPELQLIKARRETATTNHLNFHTPLTSKR